MSSHRREVIRSLAHHARAVSRDESNYKQAIRDIAEALLTITDELEALERTCDAMAVEP